MIGSRANELPDARTVTTRDRSRGSLDPASLFQTVPGIGPELAQRIHDALDVDTLEALEVACPDGTLARVPGVGARRNAAIRAALAEILDRARLRRRWVPPAAEEPPVALLLDVDREYRDKAAGGALPTIAPRRFTPTHEAWLPELIERKGFSFIAIEGDWPDAARVDHYVRHAEYAPSEWTAFARFPMWMWRNEEVRDFVDWLRARNATVDPAKRVAFHGLDLYSLYNSIRSVLNYLDDVDPRAARVARERYGCLTPWQSDPAIYGHAALTGAYETCEREVVTMLLDLMEKRQAYAEHDGERFLDAVQNARLVANAERYYRIMYYGSRAWAHNSHVGDSAATEMSSRGEYNIGHLCRKEFGNAAYSIGFGTNGGFVAAASDWDGPMEVKAVRPALSGSYERLCHESEHPRFLLPLRSPVSTAVVTALLKPRLERAIGVIYRPKTELESHYFQAILPHQFDEYIWFDETQAITPLSTEKLEGLPDTYPFGL